MFNQFNCFIILDRYCFNQKGILLDEKKNFLLATAVNKQFGVNGQMQLG